MYMYVAGVVSVYPVPVHHCVTYVPVAVLVQLNVHEPFLKTQENSLGTVLNNLCGHQSCGVPIKGKAWFL